MSTDRTTTGGSSVSPASVAQPATYSLVARHFHWWTVALVAVQVPLGILMLEYGERTKFAAPTGQMYDAHKLIGLVILAVVAARLVYRLTHGAPADEPTLEPWQRIVSHITHWSIYALLIAVPIIGWAAVSAFGPFEPFGIKLPALLARNDDQAKLLFAVHKATAILLAALIAMHIGAALFHYVIRKDGVLNRMWTSLPRRDGK
jgi:cytochrome b561